MPANVIFGDIRELGADDLRSTLQAAGISRIDTASRYQNGESEKLIGAGKLPKDFVSLDRIAQSPAPTADND
jgi:hypothetical protein